MSRSNKTDIRAFLTNMDQISCPTCSRDFELPKRYMIHPDDFDFKPIPRVLSCLHTVCHSCLEEQRERSKKGMVVCPICKTKDVIKGVGYLPLDISVLKQVVKVSGTGSMAVCSQCYDDVPSFSFCLTCSSALCEFHHQDHRLSVNTTKHNVHTFKDISYHGLHIDYNFPPVACPEVVLQDCSLYCQDCLHLISPQAMIENHRDHQVEDYKALVPPMEESVRDSNVQSKQNCSDLEKRISAVQSKLRQLDDNEEETTAEISRAFKLLHRKLETRERELLDRLDQIVQERRFMLTEQLSLLSDLHEDCAHAAKVAERLLADTANKVVEGMYLVSLSEAVEFRSDSLNEQVEKKLKEIPDVDPSVSVQFSSTDLGEITTCVRSLGAIQFPGNKNATAFASTSLSAPGPGVPSGKPLSAPLPKIRFSVTVKTETANAKDRVPKANEYVVVEAHLVDDASNPPLSKADSTRGGTPPPPPSAPQKEVAAHKESSRTLLGRVLVHTDIDRKLLSRHELHSYFESYEEDATGLPVLRVLKELVHCS